MKFACFGIGGRVSCTHANICVLNGISSAYALFLCWITIVPGKLKKMARVKKIWLVVGLASILFVILFVGNIVYVWWHIPEAYAAWDAGEMLVWYMKANDDDWPDDWNDLRTIVESEPGPFLRGRNSDEPDYMGRISKMITVDWAFDPQNPVNKTPVTRANGSPLHCYWSDPNKMIYDRIQASK